MRWRFYKKILKGLVIWLEKFSPYYLSISFRKKTFDNEALIKYVPYQQVSGEFAIVMQGQVIYKDNFTLETLKLYRHIYPEIKIILSTWKTDNSSFLKALDEMNIILVQNEPPLFAGLSNVNLQIIVSYTNTLPNL